MSLGRTVCISAGTRIFRCMLTADAPLPAVRDVDPMAIETVDIRGGYMRLVSPIRIRDSRHEPHRAKLGLGAAFLCSLPSTLLSISDSQVVSDEMSHQNSPSHYLSPYPPPANSTDVPDAYKASYDNLIDEYAAPYTTNSNHETYTIQSPSLDARTGVPLPHTPSISSQYTSKQSVDDTAPTSTRAYPPPPLAKEPDSRPLWRKARFIFSPVAGFSNPSSHRSYRILSRVDCMF